MKKLFALAAITLAFNFAFANEPTAAPAAGQAAPAAGHEMKKDEPAAGHEMKKEEAAAPAPGKKKGKKAEKH